MVSTKAAAAAFLAIAIIASIVFDQDPNNSSYNGYVPKVLPTSASSRDSLTGLTLGLSLNATTIRSGQTVNFSASEYNTLPTIDNVIVSND